MSFQSPIQPPGWYHAQGDPPGTQRYWDGQAWQGAPQQTGAGSVQGGTSPSMPSQQLADNGKRMGARVIDWIIWGVVGVVTVIPFIDFDQIGQPDATFETPAWAGLIGLLFIVGYETIMVATSGATVGKLIVGLQVVGPEGSSVGFGPALLRIAPYAVLSLINVVRPPFGVVGMVVVLIVSLVFMNQDDRHRTVWDRLAKTEVWNKAEVR